LTTHDPFERPPARPLTGYRDVAEDPDRYSRRAQVRSWLILAILVIGYLAFFLPVYFLEPGLR
jgi:hypothetical protein